MPELFSTLVGLSALVGGVAGKAWEKAIELGYEKVLEHGGAWLHGAALVRMAGEFGLATNHDAERAVRRAQIAALTALLRVYDRHVPKADEQAQFPGMFSEAADAFVRSARTRSGEAELDARADQIAQVVAILDAALVPKRDAGLAARLAVLREVAAQALFSEFESAIAGSQDPRTGRPVVVPAGFRTLFFTGWPKSGEHAAIVPWHDGFILFAARALTGSDETFRKLYQVTRIAGIAELGQDTNAAVRRLEAGLDALAGEIRGGAAALARLEEWLAESARVWERVERKIDGLSEAVAEQVVARLPPELLRQAEEAKLQRRVVIMLAQRLNPSDVLDFDRAITELEEAVSVALDVIARGERGSNENAFVAEMLARIARLTRSGDLDGGARAVDGALDKLELREAERAEAYRRSRRALLEAGIEQDVLRRDAEAVAQRIAALAALLHPGERPAWSATFLERLGRYYDEGNQRGLNFSLAVATALARQRLSAALIPDERGNAGILLGLALSTLGERESGTERLTEAVAAYRAALEEWIRERFSLDWATTQNNLGNALRAIGERESDTARLEQAVEAFRAALKGRTREREPLNWAMTQSNLGTALRSIGERESGTARLDQAVKAYRNALKEFTREHVPLEWATTQNNLGNALATLGQRESGTARLDQAVKAFRKALKEMTRERAPLKWAGTQTNLGNALQTLGQRESGTTRLDQAVKAYRDALEEWTRERVPLQWATVQNNLGSALRTLGERESGTTLLNQAIEAYRAALEERTRERVPLQWAMTQDNLGLTLQALGERESGTSRLEEAVAAYRAALEERTRERVPLQWATTQNNLGFALQTLGARESGTDRLTEAVAAYRGALEECTQERAPHFHQFAQANLGIAEALLTQRRAAAR